MRILFASYFFLHLWKGILEIQAVLPKCHAAFTIATKHEGIVHAGFAPHALSLLLVQDTRSHCRLAWPPA